MKTAIKGNMRCWSYIYYLKEDGEWENSIDGGVVKNNIYSMKTYLTLLEESEKYDYALDEYDLITFNPKRLVEILKETTGKEKLELLWEDEYVALGKRLYQYDASEGAPYYGFDMNYVEAFNGVLSQYADDFNGDGQLEMITVRLEKKPETYEGEYGEYYEIRTQIYIELSRIQDGNFVELDTITDWELYETTGGCARMYQGNFFVFSYNDEKYLAVDTWNKDFELGSYETVDLYKITSKFEYVQSFMESESADPYLSVMGGTFDKEEGIFDMPYFYDGIYIGEEVSQEYDQVCQIRNKYADLFQTHGLFRTQSRFWDFSETIYGGAGLGSENLEQIYRPVQGDFIWSAGIRNYSDKGIWYEAYDNSPDAIFYREE